MKIKTLAILGAATLSLSGFAQAGTCTGGDGGGCALTASNSATDNTYTAGTDGFVVNDFTFSTSANVGLNSAEDSVAVAVGTASNKGRNAFTGSSNGGSVSNCGEPTTGSAIPDVPSPSTDAADESGCTGS